MSLHFDSFVKAKWHFKVVSDQMETGLEALNEKVYLVE